MDYYSDEIKDFIFANENRGLLEKMSAETVKHDSGKPDMTLVDPDFMEVVAKVLMFGAKKYDRDNWRKGTKHSRVLAAAYRHLNKILKGEYYDEESGLPHLHHAATNLMFLDYYVRNKVGRPDIWKS